MYSIYFPCTDVYQKHCVLLHMYWAYSNVCVQHGGDLWVTLDMRKKIVLFCIYLARYLLFLWMKMGYTRVRWHNKNENHFTSTEWMMIFFMCCCCLFTSAVVRMRGKVEPPKITNNPVRWCDAYTRSFVWFLLLLLRCCCFFCYFVLIPILSFVSVCMMEPMKREKTLWFLVTVYSFCILLWFSFNCTHLCVLSERVLMSLAVVCCCCCYLLLFVNNTIDDG